MIGAFTNLLVTALIATEPSGMVKVVVLLFAFSNVTEVLPEIVSQRAKRSFSGILAVS